MVRAAMSLRRLKKGSEEDKKPTRAVLLLRARAVISEGLGSAAAESAAGDGEKASSTYLQATQISAMIEIGVVNHSSRVQNTILRDSLAHLCIWGST
jgi:hypothetical protein